MNATLGGWFTTLSTACAVVATTPSTPFVPPPTLAPPITPRGGLHILQLPHMVIQIIFVIVNNHGILDPFLLVNDLSTTGPFQISCITPSLTGPFNLKYAAP